MMPIIANYKYQHPVAMWTCDGNCKHYRNRSVREAARSLARELGYRDLKSEKLKVVETFIKWRDRAYIILPWLFQSLCYECLPIVFDTLLGTGGEDSSIVVVVSIAKVF